MKTGNKNQAIVLSLVAIGAVAYLGLQFLPKREAPITEAAATKGATTSAAIVPRDLPLALVGDPFSHPKLATKPIQSNPTVQPPREIGLGAAPLTLTGPDANGNFQANLGTEEIAGTDRQKPQGPQISVLAVMHAGTPVAYLQVGSEEANTYRVGGKLAKDVWLIAIGSNYVDVRIFGKVHRIQLGDTYGADGGDKE